MRTAAFTGHRPPKLGQSWDGDGFVDRLIMGHINQTIRSLDVEEAIVGGALGIDTLAAKVCWTLKIPYTVAVPFVGQELRWSERAQKLYHILLDGAQDVVTLANDYSAKTFQDRNEWMVDHSNLVIAYWDGSVGGTANCIRYAEGRKDVYDAVRDQWHSRA